MPDGPTLALVSAEQGVLYVVTVPLLIPLTLQSSVKPVRVKTVEAGVVGAIKDEVVADEPVAVLFKTEQVVVYVLVAPPLSIVNVHMSRELVGIGVISPVDSVEEDDLSATDVSAKSVLEAEQMAVYVVANPFAMVDVPHRLIELFIIDNVVIEPGIEVLTAEQGVLYVNCTPSAAVATLQKSTADVRAEMVPLAVELLATLPDSSEQGVL